MTDLPLAAIRAGRRGVPRGRTAAVPVLALTALVALGLSGCGGGPGTGSGAPAGPADAFSRYIAALDDGDYDAALALVASPGDITADAIVSLGEIEFPEPEQTGADLDEDATRGTISFAVGDIEGTVGFSQVGGGWRLDAPLFLAPVLGDTWTGNELMSDLEYLKPEVTLPDGTPLDGDAYVPVSGESTYAFPAEYSGGTRYDPVSYEYSVTYSLVDFSEVEVTAEASSEKHALVFSDAYSSEVIASLPRTPAGETEFVPSADLPDGAIYQLTVDEIAEPSLNDCERRGAPESKDVTIVCTPVQYTLTFTTDWPGLVNRGYAADAIGAQAHVAGTSFTFTEMTDSTDALVMTLVDETIPGEVSSPRDMFELEIVADPLVLPAS